MNRVSERDRAGAWAEFMDVDPAAVKAGIQSGDNLSATKMAEFSRKIMGKTIVPKAEEENAETVLTEEEITAAAEKEKNTADFLAESKKNLKK